MGYLNGLKRIKYKDYLIYYARDADHKAQVLIEGLLNTPIIEKKGRGGIRIIDLGDKQVVCRRYIHGGLFRAITGDCFFSEGRVMDELKTLIHLKEAGFPVVEPYGAIIKREGLIKRLYILTCYVKDGVDLLDYLKTVRRRDRLRLIKRLAYYMFELERLGIYHPDIHLKNIMVTPSNEMIFLDFDRASLKRMIRAKDRERMLWRMNRFVEKMEKREGLKIYPMEKALFLREYERLSGEEITNRMKRTIRYRRLISEVGWSIEKTLYRDST
jgi:tRNA A-37 threonylcarbamoyl transferase component Bud32